MAHQQDYQPQWVGLQLQLVFDTTAKPEEHDVILDKLTWDAMINGSLGKFYGLIGQASFYQVEELSDDGLKCTLRVMKEDEAKYINSFTTHRFKLNSYYGGDFDADTYIRVESTVRLPDIEVTEDMTEVTP